MRAGQRAPRSVQDRRNGEVVRRLSGNRQATSLGDRYGQVQWSQVAPHSEGEPAGAPERARPLAQHSGPERKSRSSGNSLDSISLIVCLGERSGHRGFRYLQSYLQIRRVATHHATVAGISFHDVASSTVQPAAGRRVQAKVRVTALVLRGSVKERLGRVALWRLRGCRSSNNTRRGENLLPLP